MYAMDSSNTARYRIGCAKVRIDGLKYDTARERSEESVRFLVEIYRTSGCQQFDRKHAVQVVVPSRQDYPAFPVSQTAEDAPTIGRHAEWCITCIHGKHRLEAAKEYLKMVDQLWLAEVYNDSQYHANPTLHLERRPTVCQDSPMTTEHRFNSPTHMVESSRTAIWSGSSSMRKTGATIKQRPA